MPDVGEEIQDCEDLDAQVEALLGQISQTTEQVRRQQRGEGSSTALDVAPAAAVPEGSAADPTPEAEAIEPADESGVATDEPEVEPSDEPREPPPEARVSDPEADPSLAPVDEQDPTADGDDDPGEVIAEEVSAAAADQTRQPDEPRSDGSQSGQSTPGEPALAEGVTPESDALADEDESIGREVDQLLAAAAVASDADEPTASEAQDAGEPESVPSDEPVPEDIESLDEVLAGGADDLDEADLAVNPELDEPIAAELDGIDGEFESVGLNAAQAEDAQPAPAPADTGRKPMPPEDGEDANSAPAPNGQMSEDEGKQGQAGDDRRAAAADEPETREPGADKGPDESGQGDSSGRLARVRSLAHAAGAILVLVGRRVLPRVATGAERVARALSSPLADKPRIWRDSVGWVALNTLFWALVVWINTLFLRQAAPPPHVPAPPTQVHEP